MLLFWDIDGTLLHTARAGIYAWEDALEEVTGVRADLSAFDTAGHPDYRIARRLLTDVAASPSDDTTVARLVRRYEDLLPAALTRRDGAVLPNVREILEHLEGRPAFRSMLLTGNTRRGAAAKLARYRLDRFFDGGAFSEGSRERAEIAQAAVTSARTTGWTPAEGALVIGDTPHDVRGGHAAGLPTLAVATGAYDVGALRVHEPWRVVPQLPPPGDFVRLLGAVEMPSGV